MIHLDLFSGIGGFALATEAVWPNIEHVFCDNDPFSQAILKKHWPTSKIYGDIRTFTNARSTESGGISSSERQKISTSGSVDILTGGFPCQPFSQAGRRKGTADDRYLWPEMFRVISEFHPRWVIAENVGGLVTWNDGMVLEQVCADLEGEGYEVQPFIVPACAVNAPHRRDRIWIVAHAASNRGGAESRNISETYGRSSKQLSESCLTDCHAPNAESARSKWRDLQNGGRTTDCEERKPARSKVQRRDWDEPWPQAAARLCTLDDGLPNGLVRPRGWRNAALKAAGNAIVPAVAEQIFRAINSIEEPRSVIADE